MLVEQIHGNEPNKSLRSGRHKGPQHRDVYKRQVLVGVAYYRLLRDGFPLTATDSKLQEAMNPVSYTHLCWHRRLYGALPPGTDCGQHGCLPHDGQLLWHRLPRAQDGRQREMCIRDSL